MNNLMNVIASAKEAPFKMTILYWCFRLVSLSHGQTELTKEMWEKTKSMEAERKDRLSAV